MESTLEISLSDKSTKKLKVLVLSVVEQYLIFLYSVADEYLNSSNNENTCKLKFEEIRQDLYDFVKQHSGLVLIN